MLKLFFRKRIYYFNFILMIIIAVLSGRVDSAAAVPEITATAAAVVDVETGQILYSKNKDLHWPPASLTKILTTIIAIEEGNLKDRVKVSKRAAYQEGSSIYLEPGEVLTLEDLLYGVMLESGNDAAVAVSEHISGSVEEFAELMNKKAAEIGAENSSFKNPNGLPQAGHYSSAYDQAVIMRYALANKTFAEITATRVKKIPWGNNPWSRRLVNHNELLWSYPGATGGKTGYTRAAGRCLITSAENKSREVVAVVLHSHNDWREVSQLLSYGLNNFNKVKVVKQGELLHVLKWDQALEKELNMVAEKSLDVVVPKNGQTEVKKEIFFNPELVLPISRGTRLGVLKLIVDNKVIGETNILAGNDLTYNSIFLRWWHWIVSRYSS